MKKTLVKITVFIIILISLYFLWSLTLYNYADSNYYRKTEWKEYDKIDNLFLGASPAYRGYNSNLANELTEETCFTLSTSSQSLEGSYYLLKESNESMQLNNVYLQVSFASLVDKPESTRGDAIVIDYLTNPIDKFNYARSALDTPYYIKPIYIKAHSTTNQPSLSDQYITLKNNLNFIAHEEEYINNYSLVSNNTEQYLGNGFVANNTSINYGNAVLVRDVFKICDYSEIYQYKEISYLIKIIEYCQSNDLNLTLISIPYYPGRIMALENYEDYEAFIDQITEEYDINYYDFNCIKNEWLDLTESDFKDTNHLNHIGADKFTATFCKLMEFNNENPALLNDYFYSSWDEKQYNYNRVVGLILDSDINKNIVTIQADAVSSDYLTPVYRYYIYLDNQLIESNGYSEIFDYSFPLNAKGEYLIRIESKQINSNKDYEAYQVIQLDLKK